MSLAACDILLHGFFKTSAHVCVAQHLQSMTSFLRPTTVAAVATEIVAMSDFQLAAERAEELAGPRFWLEFTPSQRRALIYQQLAHLDAAHAQLLGITFIKTPRAAPEPVHDQKSREPKTRVMPAVYARAKPSMKPQAQPPPSTAPAAKPQSPSHRMSINPFHVPKELAHGKS